MKGEGSRRPPKGDLEDAAVAAFADAVDAITTSDFHDALLKAVNRFITCDLTGIVHYSRSSMPRYLRAENVPQRDLDLYFSGLYRFDPYFRYWRERECPGVVTVREACLPDPPDDEKYRDYFTAFMPCAGVVDSVSIFCPTLGTGCLSLFFDRATAYKPSEIERLRRIFPMIRALNNANQRWVIREIVEGAAPATLDSGPRLFILIDQQGRELFASPRWKQIVGGDPEISAAFQRLKTRKDKAVERFPNGVLRMEEMGQGFALHPGAKMFFIERDQSASSPLNIDDTLQLLFGKILTPKEKAIVRLIFSGYPTIEIANRLSVALGTVKNHRKRIFKKLDITTERELFLRLINHIDASDASAKASRP
jgi:DNA-binding CsgD family transcriptional regulator/PAS domain-containing protein